MLSSASQLKTSTLSTMLQKISLSKHINYIKKLNKSNLKKAQRTAVQTK